MQSNELSREQRARTQAVEAAPKLPDALKQKTQAESQESQKIELIRSVMEARLDRLKNYKLTGDSKLWDKDYPERAKKVETFLKAIGTSTTKDAIISASNELGPKERELVIVKLIPAWSNSVGDIQKVALELIRADNGSDQVEAIAAKNLGDLFDKGVKKLESDTKAKDEIKRRASRDFGEMVKQGAFDAIDRTQRDAAEAGLEAMYQMRYIAKEYIDEKGGVPVPENLKHVWENYRDSLDIKDKWYKFSDAGETQLYSFLAYDLAPMIISGGAAGIAGKVAVSAATRATASMAIRMPAAAQYMSSGARSASIVRGSSQIVGRATLATAEAVTFDATFEGIRNLRVFTDKPNWQQDVIKNAFGFGFSRYLAGAKSFAGMQLDPVSNQLLKQGLIVPAIITGVGVGQKLLANDPDAYHGAWEEFILGAVMTGAFHMSGRVLEKRFPAKEMGVQKVEITPDGTQAVVTTPDGQKFATRMTERLKAAVGKLKGSPKNESQAASITPRETVNGAPLEPAGPNVAKAENGGKLPEVKPPMAKPQINEGPKNGDRMSVEGKEYRWSTKDQVWRGKGGDTLPQAEVLAAKDAKGNQLLIEHSRPGVQVEGAPKSVAPEVPKGPYRNESRLARLQEARQSLSSQLKEAGQPTGINVKSLSLENLQKLSGEVQKLKLDTQTQAFFKENGISSWSQFDEILVALKKREFALRPADRNNPTQGLRSSNVRFAADHLATSAKLEQYQAIAKGNPEVASVHQSLKELKFSQIRNLDAEITRLTPDTQTQTFFRENGIKNWAQFEKDLAALKRREFELRPADKNNARVRGGAVQPAEYLATSAKLEQYQAIAGQYPNRNTSNFVSQRTLNEANSNLMNTQNEIRRLDDVITHESTRPVRPAAQEPSPVTPVKQEGVSKQDTLSHSDTVDPHAKARIEAEHRIGNSPKSAEESFRIFETIKQKDPVLAIAATDPSKLAQVVRERKNTPLWPALLLLIPLVLVLSRSSDGTPEDKEKIEDICNECLNGEKSRIDESRKINGRNATRAYRESVTQRWMQSKEWKDFVKDYNSNKTILSGLTHPNQKSVVTALDAVLAKDGATVENVQALQRCIGMFKSISSGGRDPIMSLDHKEAQDGMLGHITTNELIGFVTKCTIEKASVQAPDESTQVEEAEVAEVAPYIAP